MLVFGMGLYELFVSNLDNSNSLSDEKAPYGSNLFGLFTLKVSLTIFMMYAACKLSHIQVFFFVFLMFINHLLLHDKYGWYIHKF